jgi:hypothetical protein
LQSDASLFLQKGEAPLCFDEEFFTAQIQDGAV